MFAKALMEYEKSVQLCPTVAMNWLRVALCFDNLKGLDEAKNAALKQSIWTPCCPKDMFAWAQSRIVLWTLKEQRKPFTMV
jgi:hypothetical protein